MNNNKQRRSKAVILSELAQYPSLTSEELEESICLAYKREHDDRRAQYAKNKTMIFAEQRRFILKRDGNECLFCGAHAETIDHYVPKSCGGTNDQQNMFACCRTCNSLKTDMHPNTFASVNGFSLHEIEKEMQRRINRHQVKKKDWRKIKKLKIETERINNGKDIIDN